MDVWFLQKVRWIIIYQNEHNFSKFHSYFYWFKFSINYSHVLINQVGGYSKVFRFPHVRDMLSIHSFYVFSIRQQMIQVQKSICHPIIQDFRIWINNRQNNIRLLMIIFAQCVLDRLNSIQVDVIECHHRNINIRIISFNESTWTFDFCLMFLLFLHFRCCHINQFQFVIVVIVYTRQFLHWNRIQFSISMHEWNFLCLVAARKCLPSMRSIKRWQAAEHSAALSYPIERNSFSWNGEIYQINISAGNKLFHMNGEGVPNSNNSFRCIIFMKSCSTLRSKHSQNNLSLWHFGRTVNIYARSQTDVTFVCPKKQEALPSSMHEAPVQFNSQESILQWMYLYSNQL